MSTWEYCFKRKDTNELQTELGNPSTENTQAMGEAVGLQLTGTFKTC